MENKTSIGPVIFLIVVAALTVGFVFTRPASSPALGGTGGNVYSYMATFGTFTVKGASSYSNTNSTSTTATTQTLVANDIVNYSTVVLTPNTNSVTLTLPATSTLPADYLATAGDWTQQCWVNATTTAAKTITFAAGTGYDLEVASTTAAGGTVNLTLAPGNSGCFRFIRKPATASAFDIIAQYTAFVDGD
jgi:hypothetical protein